MSIVLQLIALVALCLLICVLGSFLRHSFCTQIRGLPPYINTYRKHRKLIREKLSIRPGSSLLDLGCGDGTVLRIFTKTHKCKKAVGYDINNFAIRLGKLINWLYGYRTVTMINDNLFNANLKGFDYIYLYLYPDFVEKMEDRVYENVDEGTIVICNTFDFAKRKPFEVIHSKNGRKTLFLYKK